MQLGKDLIPLHTNDYRALRRSMIDRAGRRAMVRYGTVYVVRTIVLVCRCTVYVYVWQRMLKWTHHMVER
jgi:hypothetical protein